MTIIAIVSLFGFLSLFLFDKVDAKSVNSNILDMKDPLDFILNELVIISIAAAGASFYALFEAYRYITNASFDPKYDSIYWIRFILGIMSGVILSQFIFIDPSAYNGNATEINNAQSLGGFLTYRPLLAFLGGFSARVVHKILNSLVDSLETFISGSVRDLLKEREEQAKLMLNEKISQLKRETEFKNTNQGFKQAMKLMKIREELGGNSQVSAMVYDQIQQLINEQLSSAGVNQDIQNNQDLNSPNFVDEADYIGPLPVVAAEIPLEDDFEPSKDITPGDFDIKELDTRIGNSGLGGKGINIDF